MKVIKQKHYGDLEIDDHEKDVVQIWYKQDYDIQVLHLEIENIQELIESLKKLIPGAVCQCGYKSGKECFNKCKKS